MARIRQSDNENINSDSFLDIVANIVGILIILIVIAGVRVSQFPMLVKTETDAKSEPPVAVVEAEPTEMVEPVIVEPPVLEPTFAEPDETAEPTLPEPIPIEIAAEEPPHKPDPYIAYDPPVPTAGDLPPGPLPEPELTPDGELVNAISETAEQVQQANSAIESSKQELAQLNTQQKSLLKNRLTLDTELDAAEAARLKVSTAIIKRKEDLAEATEKLARLQRLLEEESEKQEQAAALKHTITPVGQVVSGKEIHFRLKDGKVSFVPVDELVGLLKQQVQRRKEWIVRYGSHQGQVGPVEGYSMGYVAARAKSSIITDLRNGGGAFRIGVEHWEIIESRKVPTENEAEAVQPRSQFRQRLLSATNDTNVTFWVYPDSYRIHRQVLSIAQKYGYTVASRPLPDGIPIAGSPNGSKSVGQ